jgi:hypothetical protein
MHWTNSAEATPVFTRLHVIDAPATGLAYCARLADGTVFKSSAAPELAVLLALLE